MKDYIESCYPNLSCGKQRSYEELRRILREAWDHISPEMLRGLMDSIKDRCQAVINANGGHTKD